MFPKVSPQSQVLGYSLPKLHTGKSWYIDFFAIDPALGHLRRKKYMLDSIKGISARRRHAYIMIHELTQKLHHSRCLRREGKRLVGK